MRLNHSWIACDLCPTLTFEDKFSYLCRAYEKFSKEVSAQQPAVILGDEYYNRLQEQIRLTQCYIRCLAKEIEDDPASNADNKQARIKLLKRIEKRMTQPLNFNVSFGELVLGLAKQHGLADPEVMCNFYGGEDDWALKLNGAYRAKVMHGSFFDFASKDYTVREVTIIMYHLHDLLVRILLKMLGYNGHYRPSIWASSPDHDVNWVTPTLPPHELGYNPIDEKAKD